MCHPMTWPLIETCTACYVISASFTFWICLYSKISSSFTPVSQNAAYFLLAILQDPLLTMSGFQLVYCFIYTMLHTTYCLDRFLVNLIGLFFNFVCICYLVPTRPTLCQYWGGSLTYTMLIIVLYLYLTKRSQRAS